MDYKTHISQVFDRSAPLYGGFGAHYFDIFAKRLVERTKGFLGASILDVATGRGAVLKNALKNLGDEGKAYGIDISPAMIEKTALEICGENVFLQCMDAENLAFKDGTFDIVYCGFGLVFFPDMKKAMKEFKRVLKKGGQLAISTWGQGGEPRRRFKEELSLRGVDPEVTANPWPNEVELKELFKEAGFSTTEIIADKLDHVFLNFDHYWDSQWTHAIRSSMEKLSETQAFEIKAALCEKLEHLNRPDGFHEELSVYYTTATS